MLADLSIFCVRQGEHSLTQTQAFADEKVLGQSTACLPCTHALNIS